MCEFVGTHGGAGPDPRVPCQALVPSCVNCTGPSVPQGSPTHTPSHTWDPGTPPELLLRPQGGSGLLCPCLKPGSLPLGDGGDRVEADSSAYTIPEWLCGQPSGPLGCPEGRGAGCCLYFAAGNGVLALWVAFSHSRTVAERPSGGLNPDLRDRPSAPGLTAQTREDAWWPHVAEAKPPRKRPSQLGALHARNPERHNCSHVCEHEEPRARRPTPGVFTPRLVVEGSPARVRPVDSHRLGRRAATRAVIPAEN